MKRLPAALVTGALLVAPLSACGGHETAKPRTNASSAAPDSDVKAFVAQLSNAMKKQKSARMTISVGGGLSGTSDVSYGATTDARITANYGSGRGQILLVGGVAYLQQDAGGKFVKIDKDDPVMGGLIKQLAFAGPREALAGIAPGITKVEPLTATGPLTTVGYEVTVDGAVAGRTFLAGSDEKMPKTITLEFTLDENTRLIESVTGDVGGTKLSIRISRWGEPVRITAPRPDQMLSSGLEAG